MKQADPISMLGTRVRNLRGKKRLTLEQVAKKIGVTQNPVHSGETNTP